ncbi:MAG: ATP-binding cassette domain-containing protein [Geminicoccaceae bacterium]|nr:MAG: ATP-binding cassette domain-containing protein [Geminicoccaceae bacterium]
MTLVLDQTTVRLDGKRLFQPLALTVAPGEIVALMGPSGRGKSSLLMGLCGGLRPPLALEGDVRLGGRSLRGVPLERRRLGVLFQDPLLFPHLTVAENLAFALPRQHRDRRVRIDAALERAELQGFGERRPSTLSGGQAARVALLRALLAEPQALLLDEPFAKLDAPLRRRVRAFVATMIADARLPCLLVTHDRADAQDLGARVVELGGEGEERTRTGR